MDMLAAAPGTVNFTKAGLTAGTTTTLSTTATVQYSIVGKSYSKTAITNQATPTTDWATGLAFLPIPIPLTSPNLPSVPNAALGYGSVYLVGFDSGGTLRVIQGSVAPLDVAGAFVTGPVLPSGLGPVGSGSTANDFCPIGYLVVKLGATAVATWTFGTNNNSSVTGVTYTFVDISTVPGRPQIS